MIGRDERTKERIKGLEDILRVALARSLPKKEREAARRGEGSDPPEAPSKSTDEETMSVRTEK